MKRPTFGDLGTRDLARKDLTKIAYKDGPEDLNVHEIPLPTQIPQPVDLSELPEHVLKSGTIEMLIQQNEDLLARLSVSLRRNSNLESRLQQGEMEMRNLTLENSTLKDQILVFQEKDQSWKGRIHKAEEKRQEAEEDLRLTAFKLRELENTSQKRLTELTTSLVRAEGDLSRLQRYHQRIQKFVRPGLREVRSQLKLRGERIQELQSMVIDRELKYTALQERLAQMLDHLKEKSKTHQNDIQLLNEQMQKELSARETEIQGLQRQLAIYSDKAKRLELMLEKEIEWENRLIRSERLREEIVQRYDKDLAAQREQVLTGKSLNAKLTRENEEMNRAILALHAEFDQIKKEFAALHEQKENLQLVWRENTQYIEQLEIREQTLQRLNQDLSARLNDLRRQLENESSRAATQQLQAELKSRALNEELSLLRQHQSPHADPTATLDNRPCESQKCEENPTNSPTTDNPSASDTSDRPAPTHDGPEAAAVGIGENNPVPPLVDSTAPSAPNEPPKPHYHQKMLKRIEDLLGELQVGLSANKKNRRPFKASLPGFTFIEENTTKPSSLAPTIETIPGSPPMTVQTGNEQRREAAAGRFVDEEIEQFIRKPGEDYARDAVNVAFKRLEEKRRQIPTPAPEIEIFEPVSLENLTVPDAQPELESKVNLIPTPEIKDEATQEIQPAAEDLPR